MASLEELGNALRKADAAGNSADAKVLADEIRRMQQPYGSDTAIAQGTNFGLAGFLGTPVDLMTSAIEKNTATAAQYPNSPFYGPGLKFQTPVGGSEWWRNLFRKVNLPSGKPLTYENLSQVPEQY